MPTSHVNLAEGKRTCKTTCCSGSWGEMFAPSPAPADTRLAGAATDAAFTMASTTQPAVPCCIMSWPASSRDASWASS
jgi:hypothetical protein